MIRLLQTIIFLLPLLLTAETITIKTKAPQNRNAVFRYRVPKGYDKNRREMYRVLVIFGGRNTDGKADASGRMGWGKWTTSDPLGYPDGWNNLAYVNNGVTNTFDWLGAWKLHYESGETSITEGKQFRRICNLS